MPIVGTRTTLPARRVVHAQVEAHAAARPAAPAVTSGPAELTFAELNAQANRLAHTLIDRGVGRWSVVGVAQDRTVDLLPSILAVLKAGAAYVPLDPTYPPDRLGQMVAQLPDKPLVLVGESTRSTLRNHAVETLQVEELVDDAADAYGDPDVGVTGDDLCYVVFTSGSTGRPKATAIRHEGWFNLLSWLGREYALGAESSGLCVSSFGFDITQRALMAPLFTGACSHLLASRHFDPRMAYRIIDARGVKTLHCAPTTLYSLIDAETTIGGRALQTVAHVFIGGEPLNAGRVRSWAEQPSNTCRLWHQYGVAECTDVATSHLLEDFERYERSGLPVGPPVHNTEIAVLDDDLREVPDGRVAEICISGLGVSAGYLNPGPEVDGRFTSVVRDGRSTPIYRTGDRGYIDERGELVVVGRVDDQVKIRGMRIDLGDVEHAVRANGAVRDAVVLADGPDPDALRLIAFVELVDGGSSDAARLRKELFHALPRNMVPEAIVLVPALPLGPNGKIDRRALTSSIVEPPP